MDWEILGLIVLAAKVVGDALLTLLACAAGIFTLLFSLLSLACAVWFFRFRPRRYASTFLPPLTILKPIKGEDRELYENLASFCALDYPRLQILFAVASPEDCALATLARLRRDFPELDMETVVSGHRIGFNPKVNNLSNAAPYIKHDFLLISDSDIRVQPDFLRRAVAPFSDPAVGLVTCFYQSATPRGLWSRLEALSVNAHFLPQAVTAAACGMRFAMGAAMLVRREAFEKTGGFANLADHLADDFILGQSIQAAGYRLEFSDAVVDSVPDVAGAREHIRHQIRWARTVRICQPWGYLGLALLHGFSLLTLKAVLFGLDSFTACLALAIVAAKTLAQRLTSRLFLGDRQDSVSPLLLPLSEWISFGAWLSGYRSDNVLWRGQLYSVHAKGRLAPPASPHFKAAPTATVEP